MPPSIIIDTSLSNDKTAYYALGEDEVWRADDIAAESEAYWTKVFDVADWEEEKPNLRLSRVLAAYSTPGLVFVLGSADSEAEGFTDTWLFRSENEGLTWEDILVAEQTGEKVSVELEMPTDPTRYFSGSAAEYTVTGEVVSPIIGRVTFDGTRTNALQQWPSIKDKSSFTILNGEDFVQAKIRITGTRMHSDWPSEADCSGGDNAASPGLIYIDIGGEHSVDKTDLGDGVIEYTSETPRNIEHMIFYGSVPSGNMHGGCPKIGTHNLFDFTIEIIEWNNVESGGPSTAIDMARINNNWMYIGLDDKIMMSIDGGFTWSILTEDYGAWDLAVHPTLAGTFTFWTPDGELRQWTGLEALPAIVTGTTPKRNAHRIAYNEVNGSRLWVLSPTGGEMYDLKRWDLGDLTDQLTNVFIGRGLHAYQNDEGQTTVVFVEEGKIRLSTDDGDTFEDKIGDWAGMTGPVNIHLL